MGKSGFLNHNCADSCSANKKSIVQVPINQVSFKYWKQKKVPSPTEQFA